MCEGQGKGQEQRCTKDGAQEGRRQVNLEFFERGVWSCWDTFVWQGRRWRSGVRLDMFERGGQAEMFLQFVAVCCALLCHKNVSSPLKIDRAT